MCLASEETKTMSEAHERAWRDEQIAHRTACEAAWVATARATRRTSNWAVQIFELLIWSMKLMAALFVLALVPLVMLRYTLPGIVDAKDAALTLSIIVFGVILPFSRKLWPSSPFRNIWVETYRKSRAVASIDNR